MGISPSRESSLQESTWLQKTLQLSPILCPTSSSWPHLLLAQTEEQHTGISHQRILLVWKVWIPCAFLLSKLTALFPLARFPLASFAWIPPSFIPRVAFPCFLPVPWCSSLSGSRKPFASSPVWLCVPLGAGTF